MSSFKPIAMSNKCTQILAIFDTMTLEEKKCLCSVFIWRGFNLAFEVLEQIEKIEKLNNSENISNI